MKLLNYNSTNEDFLQHQYRIIERFVDLMTPNGIVNLADLSKNICIFINKTLCFFHIALISFHEIAQL